MGDSRSPRRARKVTSPLGPRGPRARQGVRQGLEEAGGLMHLFPNGPRDSGVLVRLCRLWGTERHLLAGLAGLAGWFCAVAPTLSSRLTWSAGTTVARHRAWLCRCFLNSHLGLRAQASGPRCLSLRLGRCWRLPEVQPRSPEAWGSPTLTSRDPGHLHSTWIQVRAGSPCRPCLPRESLKSPPCQKRGPHLKWKFTGSSTRARRLVGPWGPLGMGCGSRCHRMEPCTFMWVLMVLWVAGSGGIFSVLFASEPLETFRSSDQGGCPRFPSEPPGGGSCRVRTGTTPHTQEHPWPWPPGSMATALQSHCLHCVSGRWGPQFPETTAASSSPGNQGQVVKPVPAAILVSSLMDQEEEMGLTRSRLCPLFLAPAVSY